MYLKSAIAFLTYVAGAFPAAATSMPTPHEVEIPAKEATLRAELYKPEGDGPFPTVIALHDCGGLAGRSESVLPRYRDWAEGLLQGRKGRLAAVRHWLAGG